MLRSSKRLHASPLVLVLVALAVLVPDSASAAGKTVPVKYTAIPIGGGSYSGINNHGDVVGRARGTNLDGTSFYYAALWPADAPQPIDLEEEVFADLLLAGTLDLYPGLSIRNASGINDLGQICGLCMYADTDRTRQHAYFYDPADGYFAVLPRITDPQLGDLFMSMPNGINYYGVVVGRCENDNRTLSAAVVWDPDTGNVQVLNVPDGSVNLFSAAAINDSGVVVCNGKLKTTGDQRAVIYTPGALKPYNVLKPLGTYGSTSYTLATGINELGEVTGTTTTSKGSGFAFRYTVAGQVVALGSLSSGGSDGLAINDESQLVGVYKDRFSNGYPFLYTPGTGMLDVWSLIVDPPAKSSLDALEIINPAAGQKFGRILLYSHPEDATYLLVPDR